MGHKLVRLLGGSVEAYRGVYYLNHRGTRLMLTTVFLSLVKRLFVISLPDERGV